MPQAVMLVRGAAVEALLTGLPLPSCSATQVLRDLPPPLVLGMGAPEAGMRCGRGWCPFKAPVGFLAS